MKKLLLIVLLLSSPAFAARAFYVGETKSGMTKQCHYEYLGERYSITIANYKLCPMSIEV